VLGDNDGSACRSLRDVLAGEAVVPIDAAFFVDALLSVLRQRKSDRRARVVDAIRRLVARTWRRMLTWVLQASSIGGARVFERIAAVSNEAQVLLLLRAVDAASGASSAPVYASALAAFVASRCTRLSCADTMRALLWITRFRVLVRRIECEREGSVAATESLCARL
jgi:hypothetical protein